MRSSTYILALIGIFLANDVIKCHAIRKFHRNIHHGMIHSAILDTADSSTSPDPTKSSVSTPKAPTEVPVTTPEPTTEAPVTTPEPTTKVPVTTSEPTTEAPVTTPEPTTKEPITTSKPSTKGPTTTLQPTTEPPTTSKPTPPHCIPGQRKKVNGTCNDYLECDQKFNWVQKSCSTWCHNFNPVESKCDWSWKYSCTDPTPNSPCTPNPETTTPEDTTTAAPSTTPSTTTTVPQCTNGKTKVYEKGDCKDYLECDSGSWVKKSCAWGFDFDVNQLECRWSWWTSC